MSSFLLNSFISLSCSCFDIFFDRIALGGFIGSFKNKQTSMAFWFIAVAGEFIFFLNGYLSSGVYTGKKMFFTALLNLIYYLILSLLYEATMIQRILAIISIQSLNATGEYLAIVFFTHFSPNKDNTEEFDFFTEAVISFSGQIISFFLLMIIIMFLRKRIRKYPPQYHISILLTPIITFTVTLSLDANSIFSSKNRFLPIALSGLLLINIINFYLLEHMLRSQQLASQKEQLETQLKLQQKHLESVTASYRNIRRLIHDTRKHAVYIYSGIETGKKDETLVYVRKFIGDLDNSYIRYNTGNLAIDALVENYKAMSEEKNIAFHAQLHLGNSKLPLSDYDICIILGNLLENAYNACCQMDKKDDTYIKLNISFANSMLVIQVVNSCCKPANPQNTDCLNHGYGLENIKSIVEKWNGQFTHRYKSENIYQAEVVISCD